MPLLQLPLSETFEANRAHSHVALAIDSADRGGRVLRLREEGSLRVRFPNVTSGPREAVLVNTAGGVAGGDRLDIDLALGADAELSVTTAAAEKIYRARGPAAVMTVRLDLSSGASLAWLPQETILFDRASLDRRFDVDLAEHSRLLLAEGLVFGRTAMGEGVESGRIVDHWRVRRSGRLVFADTLRLEGAIARKLSEAAVAAGGVALGTIVVAPGGAAEADGVRAAAAQCPGDVGVSSWNGIAVARLCAADGAVLRHDMLMILSALGAALPRLWLN